MKITSEKYYKAMIKAFLKGYLVCLRESIKRKKIIYNKRGEIA